MKLNNSPCRISCLFLVLALQAFPLSGQVDPDEISWIPRISTPPVIDGEIDPIWKSGTVFKIEKVQSGTVENEDDLSAVWYGLYDDTYFYFLIDIRDQFLESEAGADIWRNDRIEVYFNMDNVKPGGNGHSGDNYQYAFHWNKPNEQFVNNSTWTGVEWTYLTTDYGYVTEVKIPFTTLTELNAIEGFSFGFDIAINDNDGSGSYDSVTYWWNSNGQAEWSNIDGAGTVGLGETFDGNFRPVIDDLDTQIAYEESVSIINVVATDANESDILSFSSEDLPAFASLQNNGDRTASISIDGQAGSANIYKFTVNVNDGMIGTAIDITLILKDPDVEAQLPVFEPIADLQVAQSALLRLDVTAVDLDSLTVQIATTELPGFASFTDNGDKTATLIFNPDFFVIPQSYPVTLRVEDAEAGTGTISFMVEVLQTEKLTEYYCDPVNGSMDNVGSFESPWSTLQAVFESGRKFLEGDVVYLLGGYHGEVVINDANDGPVTIKPGPGAEPTVSRLALAEGAANWHVFGIQIGRSFAPEFNAETLLVVGGSNNSVSNVQIFTAPDSSGWTLDDWLQIPVNGVRISGSGNLLEGSTVMNTRMGISVRGAFNTVRNNRVRNFTGDGMRGLGNDLFFEYNYVADNYNVDDNHDDGFQSWSIGNGVVGMGTVYRITLRGNTFIQTTDPLRPFQGSLQGIGCFDGMYEGFVIENNVVVVNQWHGIALYGAVNCKILNNTVIDLDTSREPNPWITIHRHKLWSSSLPEVDRAFYQGRGNVIRNNLTTDMAVSPGFGEVDHNREVPTNQFDDFFVGYPLDLRLKSGSAAIDAGSNIGAPTRDARGFLRPGEGNERMAMVDLGAFEYGAESDNRKKVEIVDSEGGHHLQLSLDKGSLESGTWYTAIASSDLRSWSSKDNNTAFETLVDSPDLLVLRDKTSVSPGNPRFADVVISGND